MPSLLKTGFLIRTHAFLAKNWSALVRSQPLASTQYPHKLLLSFVGLVCVMGAWSGSTKHAEAAPRPIWATSNCLTHWVCAALTPLNTQIPIHLHQPSHFIGWLSHYHTHAFCAAAPVITCCALGIHTSTPEASVLAPLSPPSPHTDIHIYINKQLHRANTHPHQNYPALLLTCLTHQPSYTSHNQGTSK